ncbi:MAG: hypothetical protein ACO1O1_02455 [Adhaeribacter sp.]
MRTYFSIAVGAVLLLLATLTLAGFTQDKPAAAPSALTPVAQAPLIPAATARTPAAKPAGQLPKDQVCMVNNAYMGKKQVPVTFDNKLYYGCCTMCVNTIKNNRQVRYARDPVSGREVDKARAYIVRKPGAANGEVLYFESEASYKKFQS